MCFILGGDLYQAVATGDVEVVTDHVDHIDATGIVLKSGGHLDADVVITATGIQLQALGGVTVSIDGEKIPARAVRLPATPSRRCAQRSVVLGYSNASWTLGAE